MADRSRIRLDQPRTPRRGVPRPSYSPETFGRAAERFARFLGTARFLVYMTIFIVIWIAWNALAPKAARFDPYTFTFLTLLLSLQASYAAPLILLAQNRQADRDKNEVERDRDMNARSLAETEFLAREIAAVRLAVEQKADREDIVEPLERLTQSIERLGGVEPSLRALETEEDE
jgi:uncharacterized membrane protein